MADASRRFVIKFVGDVKGAISEIGKLDDKFAGLGGRQKAVLGAAAAGGAALGGIATAGFVSAINKAADYEQQISAVGAVAQASKEELKALNDTGLRIGKETAFSATEAAQAMEVLAANGVSVKDIVGGAADAAVALAAAGGTDLVTAADLASTAMEVWGLQTSELNDVVNRMAGAANVSRFGVEDMALAVAQGGGAAMSAGIEFGDFTTAIAAIAPLFSSGSDAGTSFKTFTQRLVPATEKATTALMDLGIITEDGANRFFDAEGNMKSMAEVVGILHEATKGLSEEARVATFNEIFGTDAMRTAVGLAGMTAEEFTKMSDAMKNTSAADVAAQRMDNFRGSSEQLKGAIESLQIEMGSKFLPVLADLAKVAAEVLPKIPTEVYIAVGAVMLLVGAFSALAFAALPIVALAGALGIGVGALVLTFGAVAAAIAAVVAIGVLLWQNWDTIKAKAGQLGDWLMNGPLGTGLGFIGDRMREAVNLAQMIAGMPGGGGGEKGYTLPASAYMRSSGGEGEDISGFDARGGLDGEFASGGVVPGPVGAPFRALVHGGETIIPHGQAMGGIVINVQGSVLSTAADLERAVLNALNNAKQRGSLGFA